MTQGIHKAMIIHRALVPECKVCILHHAVNYVRSSVVDCICKVKSNRPRIPFDEVGTRISVMHRAI